MAAIAARWRGAEFGEQSLCRLGVALFRSLEDPPSEVAHSPARQTVRAYIGEDATGQECRFPAAKAALASDQKYNNDCHRNSDRSPEMSLRRLP
eukprot:gene11710-biopygen7531